MRPSTSACCTSARLALPTRKASSIACSPLLKAVAPEEFVAFVGVGRSMLRERLDIAAGAGRGVEKQHAAGFVAGVLPGIRDVARHERAGAGPADGDLVTDL